MLTDVFQCLPRVELDACQLVSRQFRDAIEDARATLPLYPMVVSLRPSMLLVEYAASIVDVGSVTGHFFTGLRRCDTPYFRNAAISLRTRNATYARTSTDMLSAFVRWLNLRERNVRFTDLKCEAYAGELEDLFCFTDRHDIRPMHVFYKRSLVAPGCDFLSMLFGEARKCTPLPGRTDAYARGEITRPLTIGCDASVPLPELWPENGFLAGEENSPQNGPLDGRGSATMQLTTERETNFYEFSMPC
ncbi:hypothetical protein AAVH_18289 [Aphelenchoides avenae]|nr:hypothetical protein AAVH_18289 [Aphelenchus avenae]